MTPERTISMTLTINLPETVEKRLAERAAQDGKTPETLASELIRDAVVPAADRTIAEILGPFRKEFAESGMTEDEWTELMEESLKEVRELRRQGLQP
jgi:plasmid stability protein